MPYGPQEPLRRVAFISMHGCPVARLGERETGGMNVFLLQTAKELGKRKITCNAIAPGFIATAMTAVLPEKVKEGAKQLIPLGRFGEPAEVAAAAAFLASEQAGYITGQVLVVDGGLHM